MTALSINLNKIALVRNSRVTTVPNIVAHAEMCISAGADGITVHPRPDQRHIRAQDCFDLQSALNVELNIEGNPFTEPHASDQPHVGDYPGFIALVQAIRPAQVTLVPDSDQQLTSDHGFDVARDGKRLEPLIKIFKDLGCRVSLFMDPDPSAMATVDLPTPPLLLMNAATRPSARSLLASSPPASNAPCVCSRRKRLCRLLNPPAHNAP